MLGSLFPLGILEEVFESLIIHGGDVFGSRGKLFEVGNQLILHLASDALGVATLKILHCNRLEIVEKRRHIGKQAHTADKVFVERQPCRITQREQEHRRKSAPAHLHIAFLA